MSKALLVGLPRIPSTWRRLHGLLLDMAVGSKANYFLGYGAGSGILGCRVRCLGILRVLGLTASRAPDIRVLGFRAAGLEFGVSSSALYCFVSSGLRLRILSRGRVALRVKVLKS